MAEESVWLTQKSISVLFGGLAGPPSLLKVFGLNPRRVSTTRYPNDKSPPGLSRTRRGAGTGTTLRFRRRDRPLAALVYFHCPRLAGAFRRQGSRTLPTIMDHRPATAGGIETSFWRSSKLGLR